MTRSISSISLIALSALFLIQTCRCFTEPACFVGRRPWSTKVRIADSRGSGGEDDKSSSFQNRQVTRHKILEAVKKAPTKSKKCLSLLGASVALWRGPNAEIAHARAPTVETTIVAEQVATPSTATKTLVSAKGAIVVMAGSAAFFAGSRVGRNSKSQIEIPERSTSLDDLKKGREQNLKKFDRLKEIDSDFEAVMKDAVTTELPLRYEQFEKARQQNNKSEKEKAELAEKYAGIDDLEDKAYQILLDLGMVEENRFISMDEARETLKELESTSDPLQ
jgi:hypothetical protein